MYNLVMVLCAAALLAVGRSANVNRHMKMLAEIDNNIDSNVPSGSTKRFINMSQKPGPYTAHKAGTTLELTCEAIAAPAPSVHWFKNDAPLYEYDKESNEIIDTNPTSIARVSSTLLISRTDGNAQYTCLVVSGFNTARVSTIVYSTDGSIDTSERSKLVPLAPRILVSYKVFVDSIGNNIVLPCRVRGHPRPVVTWKTNHGLDAMKDPRMKVLRSGELVISPVLWSDMGEFNCRATNLFGSADIKTFVYPAKRNGTNGQTKKHEVNQVPVAS